MLDKIAFVGKRILTL